MSSSEERALHEVWKTRNALEAYDLSPLQTDIV